MYQYIKRLSALYLLKPVNVKPACNRLCSINQDIMTI